ncbi:cell division protein FtsK [Microbacterium sp. MYb72]|uniref:FtsK/SpoIIIE domain-containing protein n=1 Tax=Microbacterium sp. MYb72 TaxID=1848693 RepID=UPI000CFE0F1E|nr:FtsK/SpoIIIE domain-containing protein [Microbacterium sp. MYb72]PRB09769.1 cell division protein FtsK [Microbacterium sp. MYb72]
MDTLPISIPAAPIDGRRPPIPFLAALVPVASGIVLWLLTDSLYALCFAALGPLMIAASVIDGSRVRRKTRRDAERDGERDWQRAEGELARRHEEERRLLDHRHPDAASCLVQTPLRGTHPVDAETELVIGRGTVRSGVRAAGADDARARDFQERCGVLSDAPIVVPLGGGVCLRGAEPVVLAAVRALVVQVHLRFGAGRIALAGERLVEWGLGAFVSSGRSRRELFRLGVAREGDARPRADAVLWIASGDGDVSGGVTTVLDIIEPRRARLRTPQGVMEEIAVEGISSAQAAAIAVAAAGDETGALPDEVMLSELTSSVEGRGLSAAVGVGEQGAVVLDIVEDGPHAIVTGTTGTGKSELLVSWVTAMAAVHGPDRVVFVLADFKGGTAFEPLRALPQVAAVITDLDEAGARRGVSSLTAELRRREGVLAAAGARDIGAVGMPRLVIVIDEFAAMLQEHADLGAVFTDIAARGRALGMHLIIGTQRASGVIRDALAANCPLRLSLRVGDPADSRIVIGTDAAAELPGGALSRGLALVRRPQDSEPAVMRAALTGVADLRAVAMRWSQAERAPSPWLPVLTSTIPLETLRGEEESGAVLLGRSDDPEHQRQPVDTLRLGSERGLAVLGAAGSGRSSLLRLLRQQRPDALWIPDDPEGAWDAVTELARTGGPDLVLCDDLDVRASELPPEHSQLFVQLWDRILRGGSGTTFVLTASRASGPVGRLLDALPRRALLRMPSRVEHLAAGGESATFDRDRGPGRAWMGDRETQFAWVPEEASSEWTAPIASTGWTPTADVTAIVTSGPHSVARVLGEAYPDCEVLLAPTPPSASSRPAILVADTDTWQRNWSLWQTVRTRGEVLIRAENPADLRQLAGVRETPPFARTHAGRAWSLREAEGPRRVVVPVLDGR